MDFLDRRTPWFSAKQAELDVQDLKGLLRFEIQIGPLMIWRRHYTRIDQIFMIWGAIAAFLFGIAQFASLSWIVQAWIGSGVTLVASLVMAILTWCWTGVERLRWLIALWSGLLVVGVGLTDVSIYAHWGWVMGHLCELWLMLCSVGYGLTAGALQSRSLGLVGGIHAIGAIVLPFFMPYQYLVSGLVMSSTLFLLGEYQWDMRPPIAFANLSDEAIRFNQQQERLRRHA